MKLPEHINNPNPNIYWSNNYVVLDFETTNKDKGDALRADNQIICSAWLASEDVQQRRSTSSYYRRGGEFEQNDLLESIRRTDFIVAHNAKFELQWLKRCGLDLSTVVVFDTQIAEYVLLGNKKAGISLDECAKRYKLSAKDTIVNKMIKGGISPSDIPKQWLKRYVKKDVEITHKLFLQQRKKLEELNALKVQFTRCLLTPVLADIEFKGLCLDKERVENEYEQASRLFRECESKLSKLVGGINLNSPKQVGELLYESLGFRELRAYNGEPLRTPAGGRKTDEGTISQLVTTTNRQRSFIRLYKERAKQSARLTKSLSFFKGICDTQDGIFYGRFNQTVTATHRLSSSGRPVILKGKKKGVQFQNLPRDLKKVFKAREEGWLIGEGDGAQLEFRVGVFLGQDSQGYKDILNKEDIHKLSSSILNLSRQDAKAHTFKPLYGGMSGSAKEREYYAAFRAKYGGIFNTQTRWTYEVLKTKQLITPWGMRYYWPDVRMTSSGYITNTPSIFNYPVQGLATAEIIPIAVVYLWHRLKASKARTFVINTVHDSIIAEVPPEEQELFKELVVQSLTTDVYRYLDLVYNLKFNVPLGVGIKLGEHWGEGEEEKIDVPPPFSFKLNGEQ